MSDAAERRPVSAAPPASGWRLLALTGAIVLLACTLRFLPQLLWQGTEVDAETYRHAFDLLRAGSSPYRDPGFLYTPAFAVVGAALRDALGWRALQLGCRWATLAGVWLLAWASLVGNRWPWPAQGAAALAVSLSPLVANGVGCGNVSLLLMGPLMVALRAAERRPLLAGALAGSVNALKPLALPALAVVAVPSRGRRVPAWAWSFAVAAVLAAAGWLPLGLRHLPAMWQRAGGFPDKFFNVSLARGLALLGVPVHAVAVFLAVTAAGLLIAWRIERTLRQRVALGLAASLLALPVISPATFLLSLPVQALALERAWDGVREAGARGGDRRRPLAVLALVAAAVVGIHGAEGGIGAGELGPLVQGLVILLPLAEVAALSAYVLGVGPSCSEIATVSPTGQKGSPTDTDQHGQAWTDRPG
jgi:hypothetical protein